MKHHRTMLIALVAGLAFAGACDDKGTDDKSGKSDAKSAKDKGADDKDKAASEGKDKAKSDDAGAPPADKAGTPAAAADPPKDIVDTALAAGNFTQLTGALEKASLVEMLKGPGPFTVFAPNDEAFAKVNPKMLEALLANEEGLKNIMLLHVVKGSVTAADAAKLSDVEMASGVLLPIDASAGLSIEGHEVVKADIAASNGVIHVLDTVILPKI